MAFQIPEVIERYVATVNSNKMDALAAGFATDATVHDEGRIYKGTTAITNWMRETKAKYGHTIQALDAIARDDKTIITAQLSGNFPGSPVRLEFVFEMEDNMIKSLDIH